MSCSNVLLLVVFSVNYADGQMTGSKMAPVLGEEDICSGGEQNCALNALQQKQTPSALLQQRSAAKGANGPVPHSLLPFPADQFPVDRLNASSLLEASTGSWWCPAFCVKDIAPESQSVDLVKEELNGNPIVGWWNMPEVVSFDVQQKLQAKMTPVDLSEQLQETASNAGAPSDFSDWMTFGKASAEDMIKIMYEGSKVKGVFEHVPESLRGVYWFRGDGLPEELVTLQYSTFYPEKNVQVWPEAPFMYAWAWGTPKNAPFFGAAYGLNNSLGPITEAAGHTVYPYTFSINWGDCPKNGMYCQHAGAGNMSFGDAQACAMGDLLHPDQLGNQVQRAIPLPDFLKSTAKKITGAYTWQAVPGYKGGKDGTIFKRTCNWGFSGCDCIEFGTYDFTKVMDGDGNPVEPWYSKFVKYMGDVPIMVWSGFTSEDNQKKATANFDERAREWARHAR